MSLLSFIINRAAPLPAIESFDRFLFVGPHPDDIEIGAGATAARLAAEGKTVRFLVCTDGCYGTTNTALRGNTLVETRKAEARKSASMLGVQDLRMLGFSDGNQYDLGALRKALAREISDFAPDVIFCPDPDVISECHADHLNVGRLCKELANFASNPGIMAGFGAEPAAVKALAMYMSARCNAFVATSGYLEKQLAAIFDSHLSQFPPECADAKSIPLYLKLRAYDFGIRKLCRTAEGFRVLGTTQMHCMPEAGEIK